tara:strand:- start:62 stop:448 length:387 start_codon:yes stop_codon:yes gene_type:complete
MSWTTNINGDLVTKTINGVQNVVVAVPFYMEKTEPATDGSNKTVRVRNTVQLSYDPSSPFIQYDSLTEATVVGWVTSALGADGVSYYQTKGQEMLDLFTTQSDSSGTLYWTDVTVYKPDPESETPLPW